MITSAGFTSTSFLSARALNGTLLWMPLAGETAGTRLHQANTPNGARTKVIYFADQSACSSLGVTNSKK